MKITLIDSELPQRLKGGRMVCFMKISLSVFGVAIALITGIAEAQSPLAVEIDQKAAQLESKAVTWRRDPHQNPQT